MQVSYNPKARKRMNNKSFLRILLILSGDISLNPGPVYNNQSLHSNEWNVFRSKGIHLIHLNVNSLLPKTDEIRYIAERSRYIVIGIFESNVVVITTAQLHSTKPELRFCAGSNPACGVSEIRDGEGL